MESTKVTDHVQRALDTILHIYQGERLPILTFEDDATYDADKAETVTVYERIQLNSWESVSYNGTWAARRLMAIGDPYHADTQMIHVVCGFISSRTSAHDAYDPITETWTSFNNYPIALNAPACASDGTELYVWGGRTTSSDERDDGYKWDKASNSWTQLPNSPTAMHAGTMVYLPGPNAILLIGGEDGSSTRTNNIHKFDIDTQAFVTFNSTLNTGKAYLDAARLNDNEAIVIGGLTDAGNVLDEVETIDGLNDTTTVLSAFPTTVRSHGASQADGYVYAVGGLNDAGTFLNTAYRYDGSSWAQIGNLNTENIQMLLGGWDDNDLVPHAGLRILGGRSSSNSPADIVEKAVE